jgi:hypothetical protein
MRRVAFAWPSLRWGEVATALAEIKSEQIERTILIDSPPTVGTTLTATTPLTRSGASGFVPL